MSVSFKEGIVTYKYLQGFKFPKFLILQILGIFIFVLSIPLCCAVVKFLFLNDLIDFYSLLLVYLIAQLIKNLPAMQETLVRFLGQEDLLEKGKATHSSFLDRRIPWTI